ncbi:MAG TPA: DHH family phosphoesterase [Spongiibacteraceae bacterium]|jgi:single-stranded DNA-specific DHH superfamily exonuclease|nr:DHH family phosphoesterase [Spongiibacteraceae bacterium]HUH37552.1 DHH family phosphoesterase [Spongiibacteraceae bacterium]
MADFDAFNGDADGICSLIQLRLAEPRDSQLITGVKRDIELVERVDASTGDRVTVLDISFDKNRDAVQRVLDAGAEVLYIDHHFAGDVPENPRLTTVINTSADVCTALLVNGRLKGRYAAWAVVGAYGDNLQDSARAAAAPLALGPGQLQALEQLGIYINYNGYGAALADLHFSPEALYRCLLNYANPLDFIDEAGEDYRRLEQGYKDDMAAAAALQPERVSDEVAVFIMPDAPWARRVSGVYSNDLANQFPGRAHGVLTEKPNGNYLVSVRAPLRNKTGADVLCRQFATGGGRAAAAGINDLPKEMAGAFIAALEKQFGGA